MSVAISPRARGLEGSPRSSDPEEGMTAVGRTTARFRCPCSDAETPPPPPAPRVVYIVEAEAPGGWPALLSGRCFRCGDRFCLLAGSTLRLWALISAPMQRFGQTCTPSYINEIKHAMYLGLECNGIPPGSEIPLGQVSLARSIPCSEYTLLQDIATPAISGRVSYFRGFLFWDRSL